MFPCSPEWGGSQIRPEATGYGAVFFAENILRDEGKDLKVRLALRNNFTVIGSICFHQAMMSWP